MASSLWENFRSTYERWILHNSDSVRHLETLLKGSLFFFPGRFKEQELASELVTGSVSILGLLNDTVWLKKAKQLGDLKSSSSDRYWDSIDSFDPVRLRKLDTHRLASEGKLQNAQALPEWSKDLQPQILHQLSAIYQRTPATLFRNMRLHFVLGLLNESELLMELLAHALQSSLSHIASHNAVLDAIISRLRGSVILLIELVKASIRLVLLWRNGGRMLTSMSVPSREDSIALAGVSDEDTLEGEENADLSYQINGTSGDQAISSANGGPVPVPSLPGSTRSHRSAIYMRYTLDMIADAKKRVTPTRPTMRSILGEVMWILRPVIYVVLKLRYGRSWTPWMLSLVMDLFSRRLSQRENLSGVEQNELGRRQTLLLLYLLRSPVFEVLTELFSPATDLLYGLISRIPGMQMVWDFIAEILFVYRTRYFYLAGSGSP